MNKPRGRNVRRKETLTEEIKRIKALSGVGRHLNESETISSRHLEDDLTELLYTDGTEEIETIINYFIDTLFDNLRDAIETYEESRGEIVVPNDTGQVKKLASEIVGMNRELSRHDVFRKAAIEALYDVLVKY